MEREPVPVHDPNHFVQTFVAPEAASLLPKATQTPNGLLPTANFFAIMRIEDFARHIAFPIPVARSYFYDFFWVKQGHLVRTDGLERYQVERSMVSLYSPGNLTAVEFCSVDVQGFYCLFDAEYVLGNVKNPHTLTNLPFFQLDTTPVVSLSSEAHREAEYLLHKIEREHLGHQLDKAEYISAMLYGFLLDMKRAYGQAAALNQPISSALALTRRFKALLKQHSPVQHSVSEYADMLHVTANHLNRCVKETTGKPASALITEMLLLEAKALLKQTSDPVTEVAYRLGLEDVSYFARLFRKHTGWSPTEYRARVVQQPDA